MGLLGQFNNAYNSAQAPERSSSVPDGRYQARIEKLVVKVAGEKAKNPGAPMLAWDLVVVSGEHAGRHVFKNSVFSDAAIAFTKADLAVVGFTGQLDDLETDAGRAALLDRVVQINVKSKRDATGRDNTNVYFDKLVSLAGAAAAHHDSDSAPF